MPLVRAKSKRKEGSTCSFEGCDVKINLGDDYLWDFTNSIAYCTGHDELNSKVVENKTQGQSGSKGGFSRGTATFRTPEDGATALGIFGSFVAETMPGIIRKVESLDNKKAIPTERLDHWTKQFLAVFLGKTEVHQGGKTS